MEATEYPGVSSDGPISISLILEDPGGVEQCRDSVEVRVAPFIVLPNTASPARVLVADDDPAFEKKRCRMNSLTP